MTNTEAATTITYADEATAAALLAANSRTYTTKASRLGELEDILDPINVKAAKHGLEPIGVIVLSEAVHQVSKGGITVAVPYVTWTLSHLDITYGDHTFVASLVPEEAGMTVHCAPGQNLDGWVRPAADDQHCDHCQTNRRRTRLYIVRDNRTGALIQLGHNCVQLFLGIEPKGLWRLEIDDYFRDYEERDEDSWGGGFRRDNTISIREVLALAWVLTNEGRGYVSRAKAEEWGKQSTVEVIREFIDNPPKNPGASYSSRDPHALSDYLEYQEKCAKIAATMQDDALMEAIIASVETVKRGTDYGDNLRVIVAAESGYVSQRNMGILASLVTVYRRNLEKAVERKDAGLANAKGFLGAKGDKLKNLTLTVRTVKVWESDFGTSTFIVGTDEGNHCVVWKASRFINLEPGDTLNILSGTIKDTSTYRDTDQTVLTRCRIAEKVNA